MTGFPNFSCRIFPVVFYRDLFAHVNHMHRGPFGATFRNAQHHAGSFLRRKIQIAFASASERDHSC
jgi:hypothetical protein